MATSSTEQMMKAVEAARARSGANVGPPKPMSDEMLKRIQQNVDKANKKTSRAESSDDVMYAKKGGMTASKRADGCAVKGKTKGRMV